MRFNLSEAYDDCTRALASAEAFIEGREGKWQLFWGQGGLVDIQTHTRNHIIGTPDGSLAGIVADLSIALQALADNAEDNPCNNKQGAHGF